MNIYVTTIQPTQKSYKHSNGRTEMRDISFCGLKSPVQASKKAVGAKWAQVQFKDDVSDFQLIEDKLWDAANGTVVDPKQPLLLCISFNDYYEETPLNPSDDSRLPIKDFIKHNFRR